MTGLDRLQQDLLAAFFAREQAFFLTGGAALAGFHLHHRRTLDLDLFTTSDALDQGEESLRAAAESLDAQMERVRVSPHARRFLIRRAGESVVVDLVRDLAPQVAGEKLVEGVVRLDGPAEIMANKLCALLSRAELRDLVDVRALEAAGFSAESHLPLAMRKDSGLTAGQLAWVLAQMEIGEDATPPGDVPAAELRGYLHDLVRRLAAAAAPQR